MLSWNLGSYLSLDTCAFLVPCALCLLNSFLVAKKMTNKKDIETREDLEKLLTIFYNKLLSDDSIGYLFTEVARIDMSHHLPLITDFLGIHLIRLRHVSQRCHATASHSP